MTTRRGTIVNGLRRRSGQLRDGSTRVADRVLAGAGLRRVGRGAFGADALRDVATLLAGARRPVVVDVGANRGQSIERFTKLFPDGCELHAFEPSPALFATLHANASHLPGMHLVQAAVGSSEGRLPLLESSVPVMSSFLPPGREGWGYTVVRETPVEVTTLDAYAEREGIERIDVLKTDTQGYELEVLRGAERLLGERRVGLVLAEVIFSELYVGLPPFDSLYGHLRERGYGLVSIYNLTFDRARLSFCDMLFAARD